MKPLELDGAITVGTRESWATLSPCGTTTYDCAAMAKAHGGGGHTRAAGFSVALTGNVTDQPYALARLLVEGWES